ncbi:ABC transporter permease, partial [Acinetobacter ursingii]
AIIFAILALSLAANQAAFGLALTIFVVGLSAFVGQHFVSNSLEGLKALDIPVLSESPFIGPILFHQNFVVYLSILTFFVIWWVLAKTKLGLL